MVKTKPKAIFDPCSLSGQSSSQEKERIQKGKDTKSETWNDKKTKISKHCDIWPTIVLPSLPSFGKNEAPGKNHKEIKRTILVRYIFKFLPPDSGAATVFVNGLHLRRSIDVSEEFPSWHIY